MEETIWIIVGIIAVLITLGGLVNLVGKNSQEEKRVSADQSLDALLTMCNKMCKMPAQTYLSVSANLPSGSILNITGNLICVEIRDWRKCRRCECTLEPYQLNLSTSEAIKLFTTHKYECFFLRNPDNLTMECKG